MDTISNLTTQTLPCILKHQTLQIFKQPHIETLNTPKLSHSRPLHYNHPPPPAPILLPITTVKYVHGMIRGQTSDYPVVSASSSKP